jgi:RNA polymerase sigma-70 factor (ECF subfamily)
MATNITLTASAEPTAAIPDHEAELIRRAQAGDREAFGVLYLRHRPSVFRFALSHLHNLSDAEDIAAETFITALGRLGTFRPDEARFVDWLLGVARNKMLLHWDWQKRHPEAELPPEWDPALATQMPGPEETACLRLEVARLLSRLTPRARQVMVLQHAAGLSRDEVARTLGMSRSRIRLLTGQARASLTGAPNWTMPARKGARVLPPALCACGCGAELPAERRTTQRCATRGCRDRLRQQGRLLDVPAVAHPATDKVLAAIAVAGQDGITRADLNDRLRLPAARLDRIVSLLAARGLVREERESAATRPVVRYYALPRSAAGRAA